MRFRKISDVSMDHVDSFLGDVFLTFDVDWCSDDVLDFSIDMVEDSGLPATWFITHETPLLDRLRGNKNFELGIHPNFNPLLNGDHCYGKSTREVIDYYMKIVPEAVSVRSHSTTQNSRILHEFADAGLVFDCNCIIPNSSGIDIKPWVLWDDRIIRVPYSWEDDVHCLYQWSWDLDVHIRSSSIKVFSFHPIHVFLNTENIERYENSRSKHNDHNTLRKYVNNSSFGTRDFLNELLHLGVSS